MSDNPSQRPTRCCKNQRRLLALAPSCVGSLPMPDRALAANLAIRVRAVGIRAAVGVPVIVDGRVWGLAAVGSARSGPMPADAEVRISGFAELVGSVVVAGYRDEQKRQLLGDVSQRPLLVGSLLEGRPVDRWSSWEVARCLRLPAGGPFVVIAAEVTAVGSEALPAVESKLRGHDVYSAWRLQPDLQVGIVHITSDRHLDETLVWLVGWRRIESGSVRVSTICATRHGRCISPR